MSGKGQAAQVAKQQRWLRTALISPTISCARSPARERRQHEHALAAGAPRGGRRPPDVICQTQTRNARGANATEMLVGQGDAHGLPRDGPSTVCASPASGEAGVAGHLAPPIPSRSRPGVSEPRSRSVFGSYLWVMSGFEVVPATL